MFCVVRLHFPQDFRASPSRQHHRLSHLPRPSRAALGGVDGSSLVDRAPQDGTPLSGRKRGIPHRAAGTWRQTRKRRNPWRSRYGVQLGLALFREQWGEAPASTGPPQLDERQRRSGRRMVSDREACHEVRPDVGPGRRDPPRQTGERFGSGKARELRKGLTFVSPF